MSRILGTAAPSATALFQDYRPCPGVYDELLDSERQLRGPWRWLAEHLNGLGPQELQRRWQQAQDQLSSEGVVFNPYDAVGSSTRPWVLDAFPAVIASRDWEILADGLQQRAHLWELLLQDLFGPQHMLKQGILPAELLFGHPHYFPAYHGLHPTGQRYLGLYAADLGRDAVGEWFVSGDRARAPLGLGYTLENRIITARMLPEAFRQSRVRRLAEFFIKLQESLRSVAPRFPESPRIVIWSQGPDSQTYFEDAYLARYLGWNLVEGGDLAVRDQRLMFKTLSGLLPVEVLFRRVDDEAADPVELLPVNARGIAGLLDLIRSGKVAVVNGLGARLIEAPALQAYLPQLAHALLGEDLRLKVPPTWWCGDEAHLKFVLHHFPRMCLRPAFRRQAGPTLVVAELDQHGQEAWRKRLQNQPSDFVAQFAIPRSVTPVWDGQCARPWHMAIRTFLVMDQNSWFVLPGGLSRVSTRAHDLDHAMTAGERSQDVWILSETPVAEVTLLPAQDRPIELRRTSTELSSRVADNLLWLGRYVERADSLTRFLLTVISELIELPESHRGVLPVLLRVLAEQGQIEPGYVLKELASPLAPLETALPNMIFDPTEPRSLRSIVEHTVRLASTVRERLALDTWKIVHRARDHCLQNARHLSLVETSQLLERILTEWSAFAGLSNESMTRTHAWRFLDLGRRLERAWQLAFVLRITLSRALPNERSILEAVLRAMDSLLTYRMRYLDTVQTAPVLDLLLIDETNPRSIGFQLERIQEHVQALPRDTRQAALSAEQRASLALLNSCRLAEVFPLVQTDSRGERTALRKFLARMGDQIQRLAEILANRYLIHAGLPRHFTSGSGRT